MQVSNAFKTIHNTIKNLVKKYIKCFNLIVYITHYPLAKVLFTKYVMICGVGELVVRRGGVTGTATLVASHDGR